MQLLYSSRVRGVANMTLTGIDERGTQIRMGGGSRKGG